MHYPVVRVIAIDPAVRKTGYAVIEGDPQKQTVLDYGVITIPDRIKQSGALAAVSTSLSNLIEKFQPDEMAVEGVIYVQNRRTAISMGAARASAMIAAGKRGMNVYEYSPKSVKKAVVGKGTAKKEQVAFMIRALLHLAETPPPDAADALAIGLAHLSASDPLKASLLERRQV